MSEQQQQAPPQQQQQQQDDSCGGGCCSSLDQDVSSSSLLSSSSSSERWDHHTHAVLSVQVSPHDGTSVLSVSTNRRVALCQPNTTTTANTPSPSATTYHLPGAGHWVQVASWWGHPPRKNTTTTSQSHNQLVLACIVSDGSVEVWHVTRTTRIFCILGGAISLDLAPRNGTLLAVGNTDGTVHLWDVFHGKRVQILKKQLSKHSTQSSSSRRRKTTTTTTTNSHQQLQQHKNSPVTVVQWSPDGTHLAAGLQTGAIFVWYKKPQPNHKKLKTSPLLTSPSSSCCSSSSSAGLPWKPLTLLQGHTQSIQCLQWTRDNHRLASGSWDATVRLWSLYHKETTTTMGVEKKKSTPSTIVSAHQPHCTAVLEGHSDTVAAVAWDCQEDWLATGSWDHSVKVWNTSSLTKQQQQGQQDLLSSSSQRCALTLQGHRHGVSSVAWWQSSNNNNNKCCLVSGSLDQTVQYWKEVYLLENPPLLQLQEEQQRFESSFSSSTACLTSAEASTTTSAATTTTADAVDRSIKRRTPSSSPMPRRNRSWRWMPQ